MRNIDAPEIAGFNPIRDISSMGQPLTLYKGPRDIELILSNNGKNKVDEEPEFGDLLHNIAGFAVIHGGVLPPRSVTDDSYLPLNLLRPACVEPSYNKNNLSSIYDTDDDLIVKAFDFDKLGGKVQFDTMNKLRHTLDESHEPGLTSPRQYGILKSKNNGHETIVMEKLPGVVLGRALYPIGSKVTQSDSIRLRNGVLETVNERLADVAGRNWHRALNDVTQRHTGNILVDGPNDLSIENMQDKTYGIIDQPAANLRVKAKTFLLRSAGFSR